jgi:TolB-like protein/Flp pilus assembly protein TadD
MGESNKGVFLSYASQDAEAAKRICESLRQGGIEVWLDQSELRGGDAWDQRIRQQIRDCALFIPIISANTASRHEGYFRLEWDLADERTHKISRNRPFVIPVCLDTTSNAGADVPESFQRVQWTRLPGGETPVAFVERISKLLSPGEAPPGSQSAPAGIAAQQPSTPYSRRRPKTVALLIGLVLLLAGSGYVAFDKLFLAKPDVPPATPIAPAKTAAAGTVPEKSIAVLPFVDMSEKKDQEYFSDGLSEELIDLLAKTQGLEVIARTSSFYFKGKQATIGEISKTLNVANVMEGSVRKSGNTIRVTAQLIRASDGVHIWSETYDRDLKDVFKVQDEIAMGVVQKLKLTLLPATPAASARTVNPEAHRLYLQGRYFRDRDTSEDLAKADDCFRRALALDATYAPAWAGIATVATRQAANGYSTPAKVFVIAREAASKAIELDPKNGEAYAALGIVQMMAHEWARAEATLASAREIDPTDPSVFTNSAVLARALGRDEDAIVLFRQALEHDPINLLARRYYARTLSFAGRLSEGEAEIRQVIDTNPAQPGAHYDLGRILVAKGQIEAAGDAFEAETDASWKEIGLPLRFHALHRTAEANAALATLVSNSAGAEFQVAETYAFFGDADQAFKWLDVAGERDIGIIWLHNNPIFKGLMRDPRYASALRKLKLAK